MSVEGSRLLTQSSRTSWARTPPLTEKVYLDVTMSCRPADYPYVHHNAIKP